METKKIIIATLGCKVNQADSADIAEKYISDGFKIAAEGEVPDVCVINTCTVTAAADAEARRIIRRMRKKYPAAKIVVTGCYANVAGDELKKMPEIDELRLKTLDSGPSHSAGHGFRRNDKDGVFRGALMPRTRVQLKIQDGCDRFCSYCVVPYARGRSRSMPPENVLKRLKTFAQDGRPEVVLVGIHLGGYGLDLNPKTSLPELLASIEHSFGAAKNFRIRLSSVDPDEWTPELIKLVSASRIICPHFHIPLQSGDDEILKLMGRRYTSGQYLKLVSELKSKMPRCAIGADVIVGFPGETGAHFERTREFIENLPVDYLHVFPYSRRRLTKAASFEGAVARREKESRVRELMKLSAGKRNACYEKYVGKTLEVVIENKRDKKTGALKGISENYIPVAVDGGDELMGRMIKVKMEEKKRWLNGCGCATRIG